MFKFWKKDRAPEKTPVADPASDMAEDAAQIPPSALAQSPLASVPSNHPEVDSTIVPDSVTLEKVDEFEIDNSGKRSWRERLSGSALSRSLGSLFARKPKLDETLLDDLETALPRRTRAS